MHESDDIGLLRQFVESGSEAAFEALVAREMNLVYSAAIRHTGDPQAAQEIAQAVFIILARKAPGLLRHQTLAGWLYQTTRLTAASYRRGELRRLRREREMYMQATLNQPAGDAGEAWAQVAPLLDDAMGELSARDHNAIVLRYFQNKTLREVGSALGTTTEAAKMRLSRALEKLRRFYSRHGVALSAVAIAGAVSANSVQAAPEGLAASVAAKAAKSAVVAGSVLALVKGTLNLLVWTKYKAALGLSAAGLVVASAIATALFSTGTTSTTGTNGTPGRPAPQPFSPGAAALAEAPKPSLPEPREPFSPDALLSLEATSAAVAVQPDGKIVVGTTLFGMFVDEKAGTLGRYTRAVMRFLPDGSLDRSFCCDAVPPYSVAPMTARINLLPDGRILVSGSFDTLGGQRRHGSAILMPDGRVDESFNPWGGQTNISSQVVQQGTSYSSAVLPDGSIAIMSCALYPTPHRVLIPYHLDAAGRIVSEATSPLDEKRPPGLIMSLMGYTGDSIAECPLEMIRYAVRLPEGGAIVGVRDLSRTGSIYGSFRRYDKNWQLDPSFTNQFELDWSSQPSLHLQKDGKLVLAGMVGKMNGEDIPGLLRLDRNGAIDHTFYCKTERRFLSVNLVMDLAIQEDGRMVICGFFGQVNGVACPGLARLNPDGSLDKTFRLPFVSPEEICNRYNALRVQRLTDAAAASAASGTDAAASAAPAPETVVITSLSLSGGVAAIQFRGKPNQLYILQATELASSRIWTNIRTNQAGADGVGSLDDPKANAHPTRFYRLATP